MGYLLGIDVGTTRTAAAVSRSGSRPGDIEVVGLGDHASAVPSVLFIADDNAVVVGEAAQRRAVTDPDRVVREFKRRIGDPTPIMVAGRPWSPEELSARLVRWVVDRVAKQEGTPATRVALTHPASWGDHKKDRFGAALAGQGQPVTFLAEPQAAAMHYASAERVEPGSTIAVYDLGGGTFDAAVVHKDGHRFSLLGRPEGIEQLGGIDFDDLVFEHVRNGLPAAFEGLDETDPAVLAAVAAVRRECTEAKEALSSDTEVSIPVLTPAGQGSVRLHRSEFEALIRPRIEETVDALRRAVASAGRTPAQLSAVLLVGGSSRIPLVGQLVSEQLGRPVAVDADPKTAIAKGAALSMSPTVMANTGPLPAAVPAPRTPGLLRPALGAAAGALLGAAAYRPDALAGPPPAVPTRVPPAPRVSGTGEEPAWMPAPVPPPRPATEHLPADADHRYGTDDEYAHRRGRSPALLVSGGGLVAAVAVIASVFLWPSATPVDAGSDSRISDVPTSAAPIESAPADEPAPAADPGGVGRPVPPAGPGVPPAATTPTAVTTTEPITPPPDPTTPPPEPTTQPPDQTTPVVETPLPIGP